MNNISNAALRSALSIVLGFILVIWPEIAANYLVITIGVLFILPGAFSLIGYFYKRKSANAPKRTFPVEAVGDILFGVWLVVMPDFFINIMMYILGALLVLGGLFQIIALCRARKWSAVQWGYYIVPALVMLSGIVILAYPFGTVTTTFIVFGASMIIYGFTELVNNYKFRREDEDTNAV